MESLVDTRRGPIKRCLKSKRITMTFDDDADNIDDDNDNHTRQQNADYHPLPAPLRVVFIEATKCQELVSGV